MNKLSSLPHSMEVTYLTLAEKEMSLVAFHHEKSNTPNSGTKKKKKERKNPGSLLSWKIRLTLEKKNKWKEFINHIECSNVLVQC